jgi:hypothetical protein
MTSTGTENRIKTSQIPQVKAALLKRQGNVCPICRNALSITGSCLDHDHYTGQIRGVLCRNCNGIEGKIKNLAVRGKRHSTIKEYLGRIILYWLEHETDRTGLLHPLHKTDDEKRLARNAKAKKARAVKKKAG